MKILRTVALLLLGIAGLEAQPPVFDLSASTEARISKGWPLLLEARVMLVQEQAAKIELKEAEAWTSAVRIQITDANGLPVEVGWELLGATSGPLRFDEDAIEASAVFGLGPKVTEGLAAGTYSLEVTLDTGGKSDEGAWAGRIQSPRLRIRLDEEEDATRNILRRRLLARWLEFHGRGEEALGELNLALEVEEGNLDVLLEKADLLMTMERRDEAVAVLEKALQSFRANRGNATHPPREILRRLREAGW